MLLTYLNFIFFHTFDIFEIFPTFTFGCYENSSYLCTRKHQEQSPLGGLTNRAREEGQ